MKSLIVAFIFLVMFSSTSAWATNYECVVSQSTALRSSAEGVWLDLELRGKKIRLDCNTERGGGIKADEYHWHIARAWTTQPTQEELMELTKILEEAVDIFAQGRFGDKQIKTGVDFNKTFWG